MHTCCSTGVKKILCVGWGGVEGREGIFRLLQASSPSTASLDWQDDGEGERERQTNLTLKPQQRHTTACLGCLGQKKLPFRKEEEEIERGGGKGGGCSSVPWQSTV